MDGYLSLGAKGALDYGPRRRRRFPARERAWVVVVLTVALVLFGSTFVRADQAEGDIVGPEALTIEVPAGQPFSFTVELYLKRQGTAAAGVTWSGPAMSGSCTGISGTPNPAGFSLPEEWKNAPNGTLSKDFMTGFKSIATIWGTAGAAGSSCSLSYKGTATGRLESGNPLPPGQDTVTIIVQFVAPPNRPPTVTVNSPTVTVNEGDTATNTGTYNDPDGDPVSLSASVGQLDVDDGKWSWSFQTTDGPADSQTVTITANDGKGGVGSASFQLTVNNVPPTVLIVSLDQTIDCRKNAELTFSFSDPGVNDGEWSVMIDWGDGSTDSFNASNQGPQHPVSHAYALPGTYTVTVRVTDKDGGEGSATGSITVMQVYAVDFLPPFDDSSPSGLIVNTMKNGRVVPVKATIYDVCRESYVNDPTTEVTIKVSKTSGNGNSDPVEEYADAGQSSAGTNRFRWTADSSVPGGGFWIYNLDSKALGLVVNNLYRIDIHVGSNLATRDTWAVLQPVK
ncbi:PKD domain-containing protein [Thermoflexus hugenholtzii]